MITLLANINSKNSNGTKTVSVFAQNDGTAGSQTVTFTIIDQTVNVTEDFGANQIKVLTAAHSASGSGFIGAASGGAGDKRFCDVDAPSCGGMTPESMPTAVGS